uniref:Integrase catalytic domain-containing protein n=1 Tax=Strongyloides venezuelensis TaxID=75913 RepID=A0A0K0FRJ5_STRVS
MYVYHHPNYLRVIHIVKAREPTRLPKNPPGLHGGPTSGVETDCKFSLCLHPEYKAIHIPEKPFTEISIDHFQVVAKSDKVSVLNIVDTTSKLWVPEIVSEESSEEVLKTLKAAFYTYGFPTSIKADNQTCFRSSETMLSLKKLEIDIVFNIAKHHQGNSLVEHSFSTLRKILRAAYLENNQSLSETDFIRKNIKKIAFIYNNTNHDTTGISPFEHVFGRSGKPKMLEKILNPDYSLSFDINDLVKSWPELSKKAHEKRQNINVKLPNAGIKPLNDMEVGDIIARRQTPGSKLAALYGPNLTVKKIEYPYIYASKSHATKGRFHKIHIHDIKIIKKGGVTCSRQNDEKILKVLT